MATVCVVPSIREQSLEQFKSAWADHFKFHGVKLIVVRDGADPELEFDGQRLGKLSELLPEADRELVPTFTDSCRNFGFLWAAANLQFDNLLTFDDDVQPLPGTDPIGDHLRVLRKKVPLDWMNSINGSDFYARGVPYQVRTQAEVQVSHGLWRKNVDWDGCSQLVLTQKAATEPEWYENPGFYVGPIPRGVYFPFCGMSVACTKTALPLLYYTPQGKEVGYHRFGDIWCGLHLKRECDSRDWAIYSGASVINHTRASNVFANVRAESLGYEVNEIYYKTPDDQLPLFFAEYTRKRLKFQQRMEELLAV